MSEDEVQFNTKNPVEDAYDSDGGNFETSDEGDTSEVPPLEPARDVNETEETVTVLPTEEVTPRSSRSHTKRQSPTSRVQFLGVPVHTRAPLRIDDSSDEHSPPRGNVRRRRHEQNYSDYSTNAINQNTRHRDSQQNHRDGCAVGDEIKTYGQPPNLKIETFSGEEDFESFLSHFDICARLGHWSPQTKTLALLASMRGQAQRFVLNLRETDKHIYSVLVSKLSERFSGDRHKAMWAAKLESRKRQPGESIEALGDDICRLTRKAYGHLESEAQDTLGMQQLLKSVSAELRYKCHTEF
ncbi:MAG: hypothetical protein ABW185_11955, partial [Sedimenticola sp.]